MKAIVLSQESIKYNSTFCLVRAPLIAGGSFFINMLTIDFKDVEYNYKPPKVFFI